jgi:branched-subunit amino acid aminotransferase/4-amino-4-deoxychorismate lyase
MSSYGHFTAMQVRGGRVRGLDLHRRRLENATRRLFGTELDFERVRGYLRQAIAGGDALSARVIVFSSSMNWAEPAEPAEPDILVIVRPPHEPDLAPLRVKSFDYERTLPEIKHTGAFGLSHYMREARFAGYDDALFVNRAGLITEASIWNVGFLERGTVVWPRGPMLDGIMQQLIRKGLARHGVPSETRDVRVADLAGFDATFFTNSQAAGVPIAAVDDVELGFDPAASRILTEAYEANPWDEI